MLSLPIALSSAVILILTSFFTAIVSATTGMGGGIVLLSIMTFFLPLSAIVPIHGLVQFISNSYRCFLLRNHIIKSITIPYLIGLPFGVGISIWILKNIINKDLPLILIGFLILYAIFKPKKLPPLKIPRYGFFFVGIITGILSLLVGAIGPFLAPFFLTGEFQKQEIVATKSSLQVFAHLLKIPAFIFLNFDYMGWSPLIAVLAISSILGTKVGVKILSRIDEKMFKLIFTSLLFLSAVRIFYKVLISG